HIVRWLPLALARCTLGRHTSPLRSNWALLLCRKLFPHAPRFVKPCRLNFWWLPLLSPLPSPPPWSSRRKDPSIPCPSSGHHRTDVDDDSLRPAPRKPSCSCKPGAASS